MCRLRHFPESSADAAVCGNPFEHCRTDPYPYPIEIWKSNARVHHCWLIAMPDTAMQYPYKLCPHQELTPSTTLLLRVCLLFVNSGAATHSLAMPIDGRFPSHMGRNCVTRCGCKSQTNRVCTLPGPAATSQSMFCKTVGIFVC